MAADCECGELAGTGWWVDGFGHVGERWSKAGCKPALRGRNGGQDAEGWEWADGGWRPRRPMPLGFNCGKIVNDINN